MNFLCEFSRLRLHLSRISNLATIQPAFVFSFHTFLSIKTFRTSSSCLILPVWCFNKLVFSSCEIIFSSYFLFTREKCSFERSTRKNSKKSNYLSKRDKFSPSFIMWKLAIKTRAENQFNLLSPTRVRAICECWFYCGANGKPQKISW